MVVGSIPQCLPISSSRGIDTPVEANAETTTSVPRVVDALTPDMEKALVWQVYRGGMRKDTYLAWVHRSYRPPDKKHACRLFENEWLERMSKTPWWVVPGVWLPVSAACMTHYAMSPDASFLGGVALGACGVAMWSMLEYSLHRFVFHCDVRLPDHSALLAGHFIFHGVHHKIPADPLRLVMPPAATALIGGAIAAGLRAGLWWLPTSSVAGIFSGTLASYVGYDLTHYMLHHAHPDPKTFLGRRQRYHRRHHAESRQVRGFGVTHTFWDKIFGTSF